MGKFVVQTKGCTVPWQKGSSRPSPQNQDALAKRRNVFEVVEPMAMLFTCSWLLEGALKPGRRPQLPGRGGNGFAFQAVVAGFVAVQEKRFCSVTYPLQGEQNLNTTIALKMKLAHVLVCIPHTRALSSWVFDTLK